MWTKGVFLDRFTNESKFSVINQLYVEQMNVVACKCEVMPGLVF